ncbi:MAG TPA: DUF4388 domain-containing protein [Anaeromyxobacteraceae bacterium]|nr:DUF4388 domain-containing protein [Anaeromyxobacteraceae bacterium]
MGGLVDIDPHGRVLPQSDEARRALADRAGRFALLPSASDLLVAHRTPAAGGPASRPRCVLAGDLAAVPIGDLVAFVNQAKLSGSLTVSAAGVERTLTFQGGEVRTARSTAPGERVGEVAVRLGFLGEAQLAEALRGPRPVGKALVDLGFLSENDLWKCLHEQVTAVFHAILLLPDGVFALVDEDAFERAPLSMSTQSLLMDGIRRVDETRLFRARIPDASARPARREPRRPVPLQAAEQEVLALVDGRRSVAEIATAAHLSEFEATRVLYHLAEAGYLEAAAGPGAAPGDRLDAIARGMGEILRRVTAALPAVSRDEFLASMRSFLGDASSRFAPLWRMVIPGADGGLEPGAVLANLAALRGEALRGIEPSGDAARLLLDGMREALFYALFLAGSRIPREADEALAAEVKRRLLPLEGLV